MGYNQHTAAHCIPQFIVIRHKVLKCNLTTLIIMSAFIHLILAELDVIMNQIVKMALNAIVNFIIEFLT